MEVAAFPALARAKKLFLLRKLVARRQEAEPNAELKSPQRRQVSSSNAQEPARSARSEAVSKCTTSLMALCSDLDGQLKLINSDLMLVSTSVRREYQRESLALEKLTSELLDGQVSTDAVTQRQTTRCAVRVRARKPCIKLRVVVQSTVKDRSAPTSPKVCSRAALLARQAVKASVLQSYARFYLYRCLYRGGPSQLTAALRLASRCRRSRAFRQWRRVVTQRAKLRRRCRRAQQRIERTANAWAHTRAVEVVETEGKYAMAKEFQQCKLLAWCFKAWLGWMAQANNFKLQGTADNTVSPRPA